MTELSVLSSCASSHVTKYKLAFLRRQTLWIVMEYLGGGSCADLLKPPPHSLHESHIAIICRELLLGLTYLHREGKIHRDIKAANVLLGMDGRVKLADFGVATQLTGLKSIRNTFVGTPFWMAPEVIQQEGHDAKADVWSLGITAMELANGEPPHANIHPMKVLLQIPKQSAPRLEGASWSRDFKDFVALCLTKDVDRRPCAKDLLRHRFIKNAGKIEGLQELIQHKQEWDAQRGADKNFRYYAETMRQLRVGGNEAEEPESDEWVFETVKVAPSTAAYNIQTQKRRKVSNVDMDLCDDAMRMMEDLDLDREPSISGTMRKVSISEEAQMSPTIHRSNTKKRLSSIQKNPLGVNMSFGNSPSTVRQFRRVSPGVTTPEDENDDPLQPPKKSKAPSTFQSEQTVQMDRQPTDPFLSQAVRMKPSRTPSSASIQVADSKEASMGRKLYSAAIGISCQEVLNETGDEKKREAVARLAEAFSDLEAVDPAGMYHIMESIVGRMKTDSQLNQMLPQPQMLPPPTPSRQISTSGTVQHTPTTPNKGPRLVMAQNNPHLKSHRRRQSAQVPSRDSSAMWSPRSDDAEKKLSKAIAGSGGLEHTRAMADVMFERWCGGLRNRWPAV